MTTQVLTVSGMSCSACASHVSNAIGGLPGTSNVVVDLDGARATFDYDPNQVTIAQVIAAINEEGYTAAAA